MTCKHKWKLIGTRTVRCELCDKITVFVIDKLMTERQYGLFRMYGYKAWSMV